MEESGKVVALRRTDAGRRRISVATILALSFGALVLVSVGSVLALTVTANYRNTFDLVGQRANLLIGAMDDSLHAHMSRAEDAAAGIATLYQDRGFEIDDAGAMTAALSGALASVPDAAGMLIYDRDMNFRGVVRARPDENGVGKVETLAKQPVTTPEIRDRLEQVRQIKGLQWSEFVVSEGRLYAYVAAPLVRDGHVGGWVVAPIDLITLSEIARDLSSRFGTTAFIIDGDDRILGHEHLLTSGAAGGQTQATTLLAQFDDPVLARYAERVPLQAFSTDSTTDVEIAEARHRDRDRACWSGWMAGPATSSSPRRSPAMASGPGPSAPISPNGRSARRSCAPGGRRPSASCSSPSPWSWRSFWENAFRGRSRRSPPRRISSPISSSSG